MRPVLFTWRGRQFASYRTALTLALALFALLVVDGATAQGMAPGPVTVVVAVFMIAGMLGARLLFVLSNRHRYESRWRATLTRRDEGAAAYGGLLGGTAAGALAGVLLRLPVGQLLDIAAIAALPAVAVGRGGCLLHGCCLGRVTTSAFGVPVKREHPAGTRRVPVPLFEIALLAGLALALEAVRAGHPRPGLVFLIASAGYAAVRFFLGFLRPHARTRLALAQPQLLSLAVAGLSACALVLLPAVGAIHG